MQYSIVCVTCVHYCRPKDFDFGSTYSPFNITTIELYYHLINYFNKQNNKYFLLINPLTGVLVVYLSK